MNFLLVFPPGASPTYVPLGLGLLASFLRSQADPPAVRILDFNILGWEHLLSLVPGGARLKAFMQGLEGDFYDPLAYEAAGREWEAARHAMACLAEEASRYVDQGLLGSRLQPLLNDQVERIKAFGPRRIGISVLFPRQVVFALALARRLREETAETLQVILGGAALSYLEVEDLFAACPYVDALVLGEGEPAAAALSMGGRTLETAGLVTRAGGGIQRQAPARQFPVQHQPPADFRDLDLSRYLLPRPVLPVLASRGCGWLRCRFCCHNESFGRFRGRAPERVVEEFEIQMDRHGVRHFYFADPYADEVLMQGIAETVLKRGLKINFHFMGRPTAVYDERLLDVLRRAGCRWISWGIESGSQRMLDLVGKGTDVDTIRLVLARSRAAGISNLAMMLFGLPGSTDEDLEATLDFLGETWDLVDSATASTFVLYADSVFGRRPGEFGLEVTGQEVLLRAGGRPIRSRRCAFKEIAKDGTLRPPRGSLESAGWEARRRWLEARPLDSLLFAEHYLLHVSDRLPASNSPAETRPPRPLNRAG